MSNVTVLMPEPKQRYTGVAGLPLVGGKVYTYAAGTTNPKATYTDAAGTIAQANPIVLNARGEPDNAIFWSGAYRVDVKDVLGNLIYSVDNFNTDPSGIFGIISGGAGAAALGFLQQGGGAVVSNVQTELRRSFFTGQFDTPANAIIAAAGNRLFVGSSESLTVNVPGQFGSVAAALTAMANWIIHGRVKIKVADGVYNPGATTNLNHPYGQNIDIEGNVASPDNCAFFGTNPPTFDLFVISNGNRFGTISGVKADIAAKAALANNYTAFLALNGAVLNLASCKANNWYYSVAERNGGSIKATSVIASNAGDVAFWAFAGGQLQLSNCQAIGASDTVNGLGFGYQGEFGGVIEAQNCTATTCNIAGFAALSNGTGRYYNCTANANVGSGFMSRGGGQIEANGSTSTGNGRYGIEITEYGNIVQLATNTGNTLGAASNFPYFDTSTGSSRVASSAGQLRLDTNTADGVFFNTPGGAQAEVRHTPAAVNRPYLQGGATGTPAIVGATGSDAVVDLALQPKGAGSYVKFGAGYFAPAPVANGYFSVRLNDGSLVQVPCFK